MQLRMLLGKRGDGFAHMAHAKRQRQRDAQRPAQLAMLQLNCRLGLVEIGQDAGTMVIEALSGLRQVEYAGGSP